MTQTAMFFQPQHITADRPMYCNIGTLADTLLQQWKRLTRSELERTRFRKQSIARLIEQKYGVNHVLAEHYLSDIERNLPLHA